MFTLLCRIGEASNPGPINIVEPQIGCINPNGILGKCNILSQVPCTKATIWAVSETHLTSQGKSKLKRELAAQSSGYQMQMGADVAPKSQTVSAVGGKQLGVGFLTSLSCRPMTRTWDDDQWKGCRIHASCFQLGTRWIQGGVIYGFAAQPTTQETRSKTNALAQLLHERLVTQSQGLRFIAGDFNQEDGQIECMRTWANLGWINVQTWASEKFGTAIVPTCHGKTVKDHLFVSPELAMYLKSVHVDSSFFADHACLWAKFEDFSKPPLIPMWKKPSKLPWEQIHQPDKNSLDDPLTLFNSTTSAAHAVAGLAEQTATLALSECTDRSEYQNEDMSNEYEAIAKTLEDEFDLKLKERNLPPLQSHQKGRCSTREVRWVQEFSVPPVQGRENDLQPEYHGPDRKHAQWVRQTRRCINFAQLVKQNIPITSLKHVHRDQLWRSIETATGFSMPFRNWWNKQCCKEMPEFPKQPPDYVTACLLARIMTKHLRNLEQSLSRARIHKAKIRRENDTNVIFADIQDRAPEPVQMLVSEVTSTVIDLDEDNFAVVVDPPGDWQSDQHITIGQSSFEIIHAEPDKIWLTTFDNLEIGQSVFQDKYVGEVREMFHLFGKAWSKRWDRHANVDDSRWDPIIEVAKMVLSPPPEMAYAPITYEEWTQAIRKKKKRSAVGPDGYARADLIHMPKWLTERLLKMLHAIEQGATWPVQSITGFVAALEKVKNAKTVDQYRPITIFSIVFRTWGSIRSRQVLRHLAKIAPNTCTGNLPNKRTTDVWYGIQAQIEQSIFDGTTMSGAIIDLIKAFNLLPRVPVMSVLAHLNVATPILRSWANALINMRRRFVVRQAVGPAIASSTGFAEGDAMSVTAMLGVNLVCHAWCKVRFPSIHLWSYVDNIELTCEDADTALQSLSGLYDFADLMDVQIDSDKTFLWSTSPTDRKIIRAENLVVKSNARDLGGHMQYTLQVTNSTVAAKCAAMNPLWGKLCRSLASYQQKLRACKAKAWTRCLHAVESIHLADEHFDRLRTGVMQSIHASRTGASPLIHLNLIESPCNDPQFHAMVTTICTFRQYMSEEAISDVCSAIMEDVRQRPRPGPCSVLLTRVHQIGWSWVRNSTFCDHSGYTFDILQIPIQELKLRLQQGWRDRIRAIVNLRKTMKGINLTSSSVTKKGWEKLTPNEQSIMRVCLNGTFFTADRMRHCKDGEQTTSCCFCGLPDSQFHRHWECEKFSQCRRHLTTEEIEIIKTMPECVVNHGWIPEPPSLRCFQQECQNIQDTTGIFVPTYVPDSSIHLFTDGGCLAPTSGPGKLAMWGLALGSVEKDQIFPIANGLLPGILQTAVRAEIVAVISACKYVVLSNQKFSIFIDNDLVFQKLCRMKKGHIHIPNCQKDSDLWKDLQNCFNRIRHLCTAIIKVVSHQDENLCEHEADIWVARGNNAADRIATAALQSNQRVFEAWQAYHKELQQLCIFREAIHKVFLQVGQSALSSKPEGGERKPVAQPRVHQRQLQCLDITFQADREVPLRYQTNNLAQFQQWLGKLTVVGAEPQLVTWFHLNMLYEKDNDSLGFRFNKSNKRWSNVTTESRYIGFVQRTNHFARYMKGLLEAMGCVCKPYHLRPNSIALPFWTQCVFLRICPDLLERAENAFLEFAPQYASVKMLRQLV